MASIGSVWNDLTFSHLGSGGYTHLFDRPKGDVVYVNPRYKNVLVYAAQQAVMSEMRSRLYDLLPKYRRRIERKMMDRAVWQQKSMSTIIDNQKKEQSKDWGKAVFKEEGKKDIVVVAKDIYGNAVREAMILSFKDDTEHFSATYQLYEGGYGETTNALISNYLWHIDLSPQVTTHSTKNIVMTKVQGRDYTRKELVSGGDLTFTIQGKIVSPHRGLYPDNEVKKFIKIMQHNGVLDVNFMTLNLIGVKQIVVTDYSLGAIEHSNEQPYSFSCVAIEPDEDLVIKDTINIINRGLENSPMSGWYNFILKNKYAEIINNAAVSTAVNGAAFGLDKLVQKI